MTEPWTVLMGTDLLPSAEVNRSHVAQISAYTCPSGKKPIVNKETSPYGTGLFFATAKNFLLFRRWNLGCFIGFLRNGVLLDLLELFLLFFLPFLFQFFLTLFVLIVYLGQFDILSSDGLNSSKYYSIHAVWSKPIEGIQKSNDIENIIE